MLELESEVIRGSGSIPTGGNIFHWIFCFRIVNSQMPILALLAISSSLWKPQVHHFGNYLQLEPDHVTGCLPFYGIIRDFYGSSPISCKSGKILLEGAGGVRGLITVGGGEGGFWKWYTGIIKVIGDQNKQERLAFIYFSQCGSLIIRQRALLSHCQIQPIISSNELQTHYCPFIHYFQMYMEHICQGHMAL